MNAIGGGVDVPRGVLDQSGLRSVGQFPRHDLRIDRVGDTQGIVTRDQAQIADVLGVARGERALVAAAQQWLDDTPYTIFLELVGELVQVCLPPCYERLLGVADIGGINDSAPITARLPAEAGLVSDRVHQPGLAACT